MVCLIGPHSFCVIHGSSVALSVGKVCAWIKLPSCPVLGCWQWFPWWLVNALSLSHYLLFTGLAGMCGCAWFLELCSCVVCRCSLIQLGLFPRPPLPHSQIWVLLHYSPTMVLLYAHHLCTSLVHWKLSPMPELCWLKVVRLLLERVDTSNFSHRSTNFEPSQLWLATGFSIQSLEVFIIAW